MNESATGRLMGWFLLLLAAAVAVIGAWPTISPYFDPALFWLGRWAGPSLARSQALFHATTVIVALAILVVASLPAVIAARFAPQSGRRIVRGIVRLTTATALAWPALRVLAGYEH